MRLFRDQPDVCEKLCPFSRRGGRGICLLEPLLPSPPTPGNGTIPNKKNLRRPESSYRLFQKDARGPAQLYLSPAPEGAGPGPCTAERRVSMPFKHGWPSIAGRHPRLCYLCIFLTSFQRPTNPPDAFLLSHASHA